MAAKRALARFFSGIAAALTAAFCFVTSGCQVQNVYGPPPTDPGAEDIQNIQDVYGPPPGEPDEDVAD